MVTELQKQAFLDADYENRIRILDESDGAEEREYRTSLGVEDAPRTVAWQTANTPKCNRSRDGDLPGVSRDPKDHSGSSATVIFRPRRSE